MWIRLTRKLADVTLDGVLDVSDHRTGDVFELSTFDAQLLIAEGWAERYLPSSQPKDLEQREAEPTDSLSSESLLRTTLERLRRLREQTDRRHFAHAENRRVEDRIREELRDERAVTVEPKKLPHSLE